MRLLVAIVLCMNLTWQNTLGAGWFFGRVIGDVGEILEEKLSPRIEQSLENFIAPQLRASIASADASQVYSEIARQGQVTGSAINVPSKNQFYTESAAQAFCPTICKNHLFMQWNGQWDNSLNYGSVCGCVPTEDTIAVATARIRYKSIIQAANAQQAAAARIQAEEQAKTLSEMTPQEKAALAARKKAQKEAAAKARTLAYEKIERLRAWKFYGSPTQLAGRGPIQVQAWRDLQTESQAQKACPIVCQKDFGMNWTGGWGRSAATNEPACDCIPTQKTHAIVAKALAQKKPLHYGRVP